MSDSLQKKRSTVQPLVVVHHEVGDVSTKLVSELISKTVNALMERVNETGTLLSISTPTCSPIMRAENNKVVWQIIATATVRHDTEDIPGKLELPTDVQQFIDKAAASGSSVNIISQGSAPDFRQFEQTGGASANSPTISAAEFQQRVANAIGGIPKRQKSPLSEINTPKLANKPEVVEEGLREKDTQAISTRCVLPTDGSRQQFPSVGKIR